MFAIVLAVAGCRERTARPAPRRASATSKRGEDEFLPSRDAYAGSEVCADCHQKNHDRWAHSWHARALAKATPNDVVGNFGGAHFHGESSEAWMRKRGDAYVMRTRDRAGKQGDFDVSYVIGAKRMQDDVTVFPDGRWQVLPVYYHVTGHGAWVDYNEKKQGQIGPDHPFFWTNFRRTANKECLECHTTGLDLRYDRATHAWRTSFVDAGVACEACHGPGARHAETKAKEDILHPGHVAKDVQLSLCARCHGPREPIFPLLDAHDQFRPGDRYGDKFQPLVVTDSTDRSGEYFADGRPSSSSFEYQALLQSRCYLAGGATCLSCHTAPHEDHERDDLKPGDVCLSCHKNLAPDHGHHAKATCVDCHMPPTLSGVLDKFADHAIDIPNPLNTVRHGVPNACNVCHADKSPQSMQAAIEKWWPSAPARQRRRLQLADAIDEKGASMSLAALTAVVRDASEAPSLRGAAAQLLGQRFPTQTPSVVIPLLHERDALLRTRLLESLGYANARANAEDVAAFLDDPSVEVRQAAALVLASFGDARATPALQKLANDPATRGLVRPHIALGIAAARRGDFDAATRELTVAVDEVPYAIDALVLLADLDARRGNLASARNWLEEALRFNPSHRGALERMRMINGKDVGTGFSRSRDGLKPVPTLTGTRARTHLPQ
ncbi:MAG: ammonia-forming cytochrome c nitrite reductase subunit c552 [Acidobacteria bacterium]|nr:ammonia-forming cytochrome c nitrite reductase subunit c552 [Acidobacteriota bacterium]